MPILNSPVRIDPRYLAGGSRLQIAQPFQLFENRNNYNKAPLLWEDDPDNDDQAATITHLPNESGVSMQITGNANDKASRQTFEHFAYTPSKPMKFEFACLFPSKTTNLRCRAGAFTTDNGYFLEQADSTYNIVRRTKVTGSAVDNPVAQASWNTDTLDGSGDANNPSGKNLDMTKINLIYIEYLWYGAGPARVGFEIDGIPIIAHQFNTTNTLSAPICSTGNLPLRYEMKNTGLTSVTSTMKTYGASVVSEGGETQDRGYFVSATSGNITATTAPDHAISVRPKATFNSIVNRAKFEIESIEVLVEGTDPIRWEIVYGQALSGASYTSAGASSAFEYAVNSTLSGTPTITGPSGYAAASNTVKGSARAKASNVLPVCLDAAGVARDDGTLTVLVQSTAASGTSVCEVVINWREIY